ncbi:MAG: nucleotide exchange factor GrpE [Candidatus Woesearchaeota archaeon]
MTNQEYNTKKENFERIDSEIEETKKNENLVEKGEQEHQQNINENERKIKELTETLLRLQAEFENYKKRVARENIEIIKCASEELVKKILPVIDSFEQALKNPESKNFIKGIELIYAQLFSILKEEGLEPIESLGKKFNPYFHEVLMRENSGEEDIILEEFQKGYLLNGKLIRTAKVKIGKVMKNGETGKTN